MPHALSAVLVLSLTLSSSALSRRPASAERSQAPASVVGAGQVQLTYLGNAGWEITYGRSVILVDPFVTQFSSHPPTRAPRQIDDVLSPDTATIDRRIPRADYILVTHAHYDHALDAPYIARKTGAVIVGNSSVANLARASNVPDSALITVRGGEDYEFGTFSLRVIPSLHSAILHKRYFTVFGTGEIPRGLKPPLRRGDYRPDGGTMMYLLRIAGQQILIMGGMNYIEREVEGLRPTIALIGAAKGGIGGYDEIYDYVGRLMRALGNPRTVLPTHLDAYGDPARQPAIAEQRRDFADEVRRVSPKTRVIMPTWFEPIVLGSAR